MTGGTMVPTRTGERRAQAFDQLLRLLAEHLVRDALKEDQRESLPIRQVQHGSPARDVYR